MVKVNESLTETQNRLADERKKRRYPFEEMMSSIPWNPLNIKPIVTNIHENDVDWCLKYLKSQEPNSNNLFFRNSIIGYEWGDLQRAIVYAERFINDESMYKVSENKKVMFRDGFKDRNTILSEGKLAMADLLTQLCLLSISLEEITGDKGWKWNELRKLGAQHLEERHKDFKRDGWVDPKSKKVEK